MEGLPERLSRYITEQDYDQYTPVDQAAWRFIMRISKAFFKKHAASVYLEGLDATGVPTDFIPRVGDMNKKLESFGWQAVPVRGFIPPAIFMEFQARHILPISCEMRTAEHINYTPAPDIVHEAAGHAPIIADPAYSKYLQSYAEIAFKAIRNAYDVELFEAIRTLSDIKEAKGSTKELIAKAEQDLEDVIERGRHELPSEAALIARMNWWTVEYGLVGEVDKYWIYGAGLLSSVGESFNCLKKDVKKIKFSLDCINYSYDITRPQPQLFVTEGYQHLYDVLEEFAQQMAYRQGGSLSVDKAKTSGLVNTIELDTGLQITGKVVEYFGRVDYVRCEGPVQLSYGNKVLPEQTVKEHHHGFSTPLGRFDLEGELAAGQNVTLRFQSGIEVKGEVIETVEREGKLLIIRFKDCTATKGERTLFEPSWGVFDMAVGERVRSVYAGAADLDAYPVHTPVPNIPPEVIAESNKIKWQNPLLDAYKAVRKMRESETADLEQLKSFFERAKEPKNWLLVMEMLEVVKTFKLDRDFEHELRDQLVFVKGKRKDLESTIDRGLDCLTETFA